MKCHIMANMNDALDQLDCFASQASDYSVEVQLGVSIYEEI